MLASINLFAWPTVSSSGVAESVRMRAGGSFLPGSYPCSIFFEQEHVLLKLLARTRYKILFLVIIIDQLSMLYTNQKIVNEEIIIFHHLRVYLHF